MNARQQQGLLEITAGMLLIVAGAFTTGLAGLIFTAVGLIVIVTAGE